MCIVEASTISFTVKGYILGFVTSSLLGFANTWFDWIMFVSSRSYCASFCGMTNFLSTSAISGLPSLSWTSHASMIVLNSKVDFWIINQCHICNCVLYPHIRWSRGHIPFRVSLRGVLCWVSNLTVCYEIFFVGIDIYLCPHNIPLNSFG